MKTHTPFLSRCLRTICTTILFLAAMALPAAASAAILPEAGCLHAVHDLTVVFTIGGFFLTLAGLGCLELARRKKRSAAVSLLCLLPVITGLVLASVPTWMGYHSRRNQKAAANAYLAYAESMDTAASKKAHHAAATYNLPLAGNRTAVGCNILPDMDSVVAVLELPAIGQTLPVFFGTETAALQAGACLLPGSSYPIGGEGTHSVLVGCSGSLRAELFTDLNALREGNRFYIHILGRTLTYQVDQLQSVPAADVSFPIIPGVDQITLVTAYTGDTYFLVHGVSVNVNTP